MINFSNLRSKIWPKSGSARFTVGAVGLLLLLIGLAATLWLAWSDESTHVVKSRSDVLRNFGLLIGGIIALLFAVWRAWVAERQASASQGQVEAAREQVQAAQRQAETAQLGLLNGRFQRGVEMLGSQLLTVRLGGIYALARLAGEYSEGYHVQCMELLCAFVRHPTPDDTIVVSVAEEWGLANPIVREDVQAAISIIGERNPELSELEGKCKLRVNLRGAHLVQANLRDHLLVGANLEHASMLSADLSGANLTGANLQGANLDGANLSGAVFGRGRSLGGYPPQDSIEESHTRLTQAQLDQAFAQHKSPPLLLDGISDFETGQPLVWRGRGD